MLSLIIVTLNCRHEIKECLNSFLSDSFSSEIVVVDNGSKDGTVEFLEEISKRNQIELIKNGRNVGFAKAVNQAAEIAGGEFLFILNPDTILDGQSVQRLIKFYRSLDSKNNIVAPLIVDQKGNIESAGAIFTLTGFFVHLEKVTGRRPYQVDAVSGAALFIRREDFLNLGGFDEDFFAYSEDADLCIRAKLAGYKVWVNPNIFITHLGGQTAKKIKKEFIVFHAFKNRILLILKNFSPFVCFFIVPIHLNLIILGVLSFLVSGKLNQARAVLRAMFWNIENFSLILSKRKRVAAQSKVSDWEILKAAKIIPWNYLFRKSVSYVKKW